MSKEIKVIEIKHPREIPGGRWQGYVAEPSPEAAAVQYTEKYGGAVSVVYYKREESGRCSCYIIPEE